MTSEDLLLSAVDFAARKNLIRIEPGWTIGVLQIAEELYKEEPLFHPEEIDVKEFFPRAKYLIMRAERFRKLISTN